VTERVKELFDEHGVEIPYPKRDIYIRDHSSGAAATGPSDSASAGPVEQDE
jgi:small-conductance mechanosensitive channel